MKRIRFTKKSIMHTDMTFDDLYEEISHDWQHKAEALQARRWRSLKREMKGML